MKSPRFSLRTLFVSVALAGVCTLAVHRYIEYHAPGSRYQRTMSASAFREALAEYVEPGYTYDEVARHIGRGSPPPKGYIHHRIALQERGRYAPGTYKEGDQLVSYETDSGVHHCLQFRDGKLINFDPNYYSKPVTTISFLSDE